MATKIGIIGAGGMLQYHAAGFKQAGGEILAVADMAPGAAEKAAKEWGIAEAYTSVEEMLEKSDIDAVSIIVPNKFHAPLAIQCMNAGKHVFCEKPPALSAAELQEMIEVSEATGKKMMFNFNNRARPESREMKKLFENGTLGT
ncbi:MAG: Gfo/Idh/MocA family oxidoreductase, partial [Rubritalea sp.]|uniref:Gfo/Idh/MocA family protein n=1 Tax=Rubritalea sp. TaxID=2109375 RepID=UPI003241C6F0